MLSVAMRTCTALLAGLLIITIRSTYSSHCPYPWTTNHPSQYAWPSRCFPGLEDITCDRNTPYRTLDGSCNNLWQPSFGMANTTLVRLLKARYADDRGELPVAQSGKPLPLARKLRTLLFPDYNISDSINSLAVMTFGQFMAHDVSLIGTMRAPSGECCTSDGKLLEKKDLPDHCLVVEIPSDDKFYKEFDQTCFAFTRSEAIQEKGCAVSPRQQTAQQTHFLDLSHVYGRSSQESDSLRRNTRGHLRTQEDEDGREFLPNVDNAVGICAFAKSPGDTCFLAGDSRVNQQPPLTAVHTLFLREHNLLCDQLFLLNPHWSDEKLFQEARRLLIAQYQHIIYAHYLPIILGPDNSRHYKLYPSHLGYGFGYDERVNPGTLNMFTTATFRSLHSIIPGFIDFPIEQGHCPLASKPLVEVFNRPNLVIEDDNFDSLLRGLTRQPADQMDPYFTHQITNLLFRPEDKEFGIDLESMDITRGRDHGLPSYNAVRKACGLRRAKSFHDFDDTMSKSAWSRLAQIYADVDDVDLYVGGVLEDLRPGALVGHVFQCISAEQFRRWRSGDRFFYEYGGLPGSFRLVPSNDMPHDYNYNSNNSPKNIETHIFKYEDQLDEIRKTSLALLICRNSDHIKRMQKDIFSQLSSRNSLVKCKDIKGLNLRLWKEPYDT